MSQLDRAGLISQSNFLFPDNTSQEITPSDIRQFNTDVADSLQLSGSYATTGSNTFTGTNTFDGQVTLNNYVTLNADLETFSSNITNYGGRIQGIAHGFGNGTSTFTGSFSGDGSGLTNLDALSTASTDFSTMTFTKGDGTTFEVDVTPRRVVETVKNKNGFMPKGTPVYVSGSTGNELHVYQADAGDVNKVPATFVLDQDLNTDESGLGILSGFINGVNTSLFAAGSNIYLAVGGGYTNVQPTGSAYIQKLGNVVKSDINGSGVISGAGRVNALPNLTQNNIWLGDSNGVPQEVDKDTLGFAFTGSDNTFTGTQNFNNISVSGTGSFAYLESITGSAKIVGDAFIILNNDTPTQRYAGIAVQDSGSAGVTASFQFDGSTNDWFYEYSDDGGVTTDHGVALFGPEYNTIGTPTYNTTNTILKSDGGHHVLDSNITDTGTQITLGSNTTVNGNLEFGGSNQVIFNPNGIVEAGEVATSVLLVDTIEPNTGTAVTLNTSTIISGSTKTEVKTQGITSTTASIDFSSTSMFELTLGSGVDTHIDASNVGKGQTINVLITQDATSAGTVSFSSKFLQPSGSEYTPTSTLGGKDILTLITYSDTSKIYVANVNKFI
jgi:hypothetical protein